MSKSSKKEKERLIFDYEYGPKEVTMHVSSYADNGRIFVGLLCGDGDNKEIFGNLTVNLPAYSLEANEAFIDGNLQKEKVEFIKKYKLGKVIKGKTAKSGYGTYPIVAFNMERLKEFDRVGVEIIEGRPERYEKLLRLRSELSEILENAPNEARCNYLENEIYKSMEELHSNIVAYFRSFM